jgi:predicted metal-dependent enzyme (double-stranded beta helix superfamily)
MSAIPPHIPSDEHVGTHLLFEDDEVRIWSIVLEPGQSAKMHTHRLDYAVVTVQPGRNRRGNGDGSVDIMENQRGAVRFDRVGAGQQHDLTNVGQTRYRNVIVELKQ